MTSGVDSGHGSVPSGSLPMDSAPVTGSSDAPPVSQGFSSVNSMSSTSGISSFSDGVTPPAPEDSDATSSDLLLRAFEARLDGFIASVHEFNRRFNADDLYVNDTQSLLLMIKGMISDTQALAGAVSVDQNFGTRSTDQLNRLGSANDAVPLRGQIVTRTEDIATDTATRDDRTATQTQKETERATAQQDLTQAQDDGDTAEVARLSQLIQDLDNEIADLVTEIGTLNQQIQTMEAENAQDQAALRILNRILGSVTDQFINVGSLLQRVKQRFDPAAMETGEDLRDEVDALNQQVQVDSQRNSRVQAQAVSERRRVDRDQLQASQRVRDGQLDETLSATDFLSSSDQETLRVVFGSDDEQLQAAIDELDAQTQQSSTTLPGSADGLAIAIRVAAQDEEAVEKTVNPAAEKQYGDNLGLEGATNPQIYARLWVEARLDEGDETQNQRERLRAEGAAAEKANDQSMADILQELQSVPLEVADALEEQQEAAASISKKRLI